MAEELLSGRKKVEFRRKKPALKDGDVIYLYATAPVKAIIGTVICRGIDEGTPRALWRRYRKVAGVEWHSLLEYFDGRATGYAIAVSTQTRWAEALSIDEIRLELPGFTPPQSYFLVDKADPLFDLISSSAKN